MKKTLISLAAASLVASSAFAADKGIDIKVSGEASLYYQTIDTNGVGLALDSNGNAVARSTSMFDQDDSVANVGIQLNLGADLGNNFTFGSQVTYLGTAGLEKNLVSNVAQVASNTVLTNGNSTTDELALTKLFIAKQVGNTTLKIGRQELPMSLSPLAYSEGWNVYKNTFDAIVVINADIPKTTLVGAYVAGGTGTFNLGTTGDLLAQTNSAALGTQPVNDTAYMITASTTAIPMATVTATYYHLSQVADGTAYALIGAVGAPIGGIAADAYWLDAQIADKGLPLGLTIGLQAGQIKPDSLDAPLAAALAADALGVGEKKFKTDDTTAYGVKVSLAPADKLTVGLAYTSVNGSQNEINVAVKNTTTTESPLFTQMVANEDAISLDADTYMVQVGFDMGDMGAISAAYGMTNSGKGSLLGVDAFNNAVDFSEFDLVYTLKAGGVDYMAAYVRQDWDAITSPYIDAGTGALLNNADKADIIRVIARYSF